MRFWDYLDKNIIVKVIHWCYWYSWWGLSNSKSLTKPQLSSDDIEKSSNTQNLLGGKSPFDFSPVGKISHFGGHLDASLTIIVGKEFVFPTLFPLRWEMHDWHWFFKKPLFYWVFLLLLLIFILKIYSFPTFPTKIHIPRK